MDYKQTIEFLYSQLPAYHRIGKAAYKNDLGNSLVLDSYLGHPHTKYKTIHVAGTNGKGSVSHMIASVLMEAGFKTGLCTSPHLTDFRERIKVDGKMIPEDAVTDFVNEHRGYLNNLKPSFFEMSVAMALDYFATAGVDVAVIEVGLGGRLDSTNVITPVASVITNIGHDHLDLLGNTLEKIAVEKAGIIKPKVPVVISETQEEIGDIFITKAEEAGSEIWFADQNYSCILGNPEYSKSTRAYTIEDKLSGVSFTNESGLSGDYQAKNIQAVFQTFRVLDAIFPVTYETIMTGIHKVFENTGLSGRWQVAGRNPLIICDTGHNLEGIDYVAAQIRKIPATKVHMVIGFVSDKDISSMLPLFPEDAIYYFTKASVQRALDEKLLLVKANACGLKGKSYPDVKSAIIAARRAASPKDLIFIGGSTFIVADALINL
ncbi:MAG: Mur ligase family protein [Bacteroidota bacterium]|nr:Mur ligase family protein [Bacteroidota bacterium]